jgi:hypothetical protein
MTKIQTRLHRVVLKDSLKGRKVTPAAGLDDKSFTYVPSLNTDLQATFDRIFGTMGERQREKV